MDNHTGLAVVTQKVTNCLPFLTLIKKKRFLTLVTLTKKSNNFYVFNAFPGIRQQVICFALMPLVRTSVHRKRLKVDCKLQYLNTCMWEELNVFMPELSEQHLYPN